MIFQAREGKTEMAIICPHCKFTNKVSVSYVEDAIHDDLSLVCVVCNEPFGVVTVRKTRDAQLRIGADDAGHTCPSCDGTGFVTHEDNSVGKCYRCNETGQI